MNGLSLEQQAKWEELNAFFKTNSKYYKKIDNGNIVFNVWPGFAGGDFIVNLFLDITLNTDLYITEIDQHIKICNRAQQILPCLETRIDSAVWLETGGYFQPNPAFNSSIDELFDLYINASIPNLESMSAIDDVCYKVFNDEMRIRDIAHFKAHRLPVIPYLYYKNPEKIKMIKIGYTFDQTVLNFLSVLKPYKSYPLVDTITDNLRFELFPPNERRTDGHAISVLYKNIMKTIRVYERQIDNRVQSPHILSGIIANSLIQAERNDIAYDKMKEVLLTDVNEYISLIDSIDLDCIDIQPNYEDELSAKPYSSMMDFLSDDIIEVDYRKFFFEQDEILIKQLMKFYNSSNTFEFYRTQIYLCHQRNLKLFQLIKEELPLLAEKI